TVPVTFNGGTGGFDTLAIDGGHFNQSYYTATGPDAGTVTLDALVIHYTGLEPILDNTDVTDRVFTDTTTNDGQQIRLIDNGNPTDGFVTIDSNGTGGFESLTFPNPANTLTIHAGVGNDTIIIGQLDDGFHAAVTVYGEEGNDRLVIRDGVNFDG